MNEKIKEDWDTRRLCMNALCLGVLSRDGSCSECGKGAQQAEKTRGTEQISSKREAAQQDAHMGTGVDFSARVLCVDPLCLGVVEEGRDSCNMCGKTKG